MYYKYVISGVPSPQEIHRQDPPGPADFRCSAPLNAHPVEYLHTAKIAPCRVFFGVSFRLLQRPGSVSRATAGTSAPGMVEIRPRGPGESPSGRREAGGLAGPDQPAAAEPGVEVRRAVDPQFGAGASPSGAEHRSVVVRHPHPKAADGGPEDPLRHGRCHAGSEPRRTGHLTPVCPFPAPRPSSREDTMVPGRRRRNRPGPGSAKVRSPPTRGSLRGAGPENRPPAGKDSRW
jgi:hypothetical protein